MALVRFHGLLKQRIEEVILERADVLAKGHAKTYDDYRYLVGYTQAMRDVLGICEEIEKDMT